MEVGSPVWAVAGADKTRVITIHAMYLILRFVKFVFLSIFLLGCLVWFKQVDGGKSYSGCCLIISFKCRIIGICTYFILAVEALNLKNEPIQINPATT